MSGYIAIHRKLLDWEWYPDINTRALFIHCLLKANWQDKEWKNTTIKRGSFVTSVDVLSKEVGITVKQIRGSLDKLKRTNNLEVKTTNKYSLLTVVKYDDYQKLETQKGKQKGKQTDTQRATTNNIININKRILSEIDISDVPQELRVYFNIAVEYRKLFIKNLKECNAPTAHQENATFENYVNPIKLMISNGECTVQDLRDVFEYLGDVRGAFWKKNILSTEKLRKQIQRLVIESRNKPLKPIKQKEDKL